MKVGDQVHMIEKHRNGVYINELEVLLRTEPSGARMIGVVDGTHAFINQMTMVLWPNEDEPVPAFIDELRVVSAIDLLGDLAG